MIDQFYLMLNYIMNNVSTVSLELSNKEKNDRKRFISYVESILPNYPREIGFDKWVIQVNLLEKLGNWYIKMIRDTSK